LRRILVALGAAACLLGVPVGSGIAEAAAPSPNHFYWGQCTWWAATTRPDIGAKMWGNASNWISIAQHDPSLTTSVSPKVDAIAVFPPGVDGAWWTGHVAHVNAVAPDGQSFRIDEMNFPIPGVVTQRTLMVDPRIVFIY
jgi:surface antigen